MRLAAFLLLLGCACGAKSGLSEPFVDTDASTGGSGGAGGSGGLGGFGGTGGSGGGLPDACTGTSEICNGLDDDCDSVVDDGVACFFLDGLPIAPVPSTGCGASWYGYDSPDPESANPSPDIRRSDEVVLAIQHSNACGAAHVAVIADLPQDGSGGQLDGTFSIQGGAGLVVSDEPGECSDVGESVVCNWTWQPCCTDGVLLGPLTSNACMLIRLDEASGVSGLVVLDGTNEIPRQLPANLELCMSFTPPS
jgi:hypothetical protein